MTTTSPQPVTYGRDPSIAKFSVTKYQRMIDQGILTAADAVELLENYVVYKWPTDPPRDGPSPVTYGRDESTARFSVAQYQRMIEGGIITSEDKVELLENYVVLKMPSDPPHAGTIQALRKRLGRRLPAGWDIRGQSDVALTDSQPGPDLAVCRGDETTYMTRHPTVADVGLLIEVANSSLLRDQRDKARIYARAGVPIYWIVNLVDRRIEVHTQPSGPTADPAYADVQHYAAGDAVPLVLDGVPVATIPAADLLP